jgi:hypothetical protein
MNSRTPAATVMDSKRRNYTPADLNPGSRLLDYTEHVTMKVPKTRSDIVDVIALVTIPTSFFYTASREERNFHIKKMVREKAPQVKNRTPKAI